MPVAFNPPPLPTHDVTAKTAGAGARQEGDDIFALLLAGLGSTLAASAGLERNQPASRASSRDERSDNADAAMVPLLGLMPNITTPQPVQAPPELVLRATPASGSLEPSKPAPADAQLAEGALPPPASSRLDTTTQLLADAKLTPAHEARADHRDAQASAQAALQTGDARIADAFERSFREQIHKDPPSAGTESSSDQHGSRRRGEAPANTPGEVRINDPVTHAVTEGHKPTSVAPSTRYDTAKDDGVAPQSARGEQPVVTPATSAPVQAASMLTHAAVAPAPSPVATPMPVITIAQRVDDAGFAGAAANQIAQVVFARNDRAEIRVHPAELGPIHIRVDIKSDQASLSIIASVPETRHALEASLPQLRELLAQGGITLGQANINDGNAAARQSPHDTESRPARRVDTTAEPAAPGTSVPSGEPTIGGRLLDVFA
ncbi:MAG TPA: flagellar hook-length control protein FliK [Casimicrobiaceae bacterium]|nr:flagellar hook-length control protein FliK [Casimicrobiaceae bacterium]